MTRNDLICLKKEVSVTGDDILGDLMQELRQGSNASSAPFSSTQKVVRPTQGHSAAAKYVHFLSASRKPSTSKTS